MILNHLNYLGREPEICFDYETSKIDYGHFIDMVVSKDGNYKYISVYHEDYPTNKTSYVKVYKRTGDKTTEFELIQTLSEPEGGNVGFGRAMAVSYDGNNLVVASPYKSVSGYSNNGENRYFRINESTGLYELYWTQSLGLNAGSYGLYFGHGLAMTDDGHTVFVSSLGDWYGTGNIKIYHRETPDGNYIHKGEVGRVFPAGKHGGRDIAFDNDNNLMYASDENSSTTIHKIAYNPETIALSYQGAKSLNIDGIYINKMSLNYATNQLVISGYKPSTATPSCWLLNRLGDGTYEKYLDIMKFLNKPFLMARVSFGYEGELHLPEWERLETGDMSMRSKYLQSGFFLEKTANLEAESSRMYPVLAGGQVNFYTKSEVHQVLRTDKLELPNPIKKSGDRFGRQLKMSGDGDYLFVVHDTYNGTSSGIFRYKRCDSGWQLDYTLLQTELGMMFSTVVSNHDASVIITGALNTTLTVWKWNGNDYVKFTEIVCTVATVNITATKDLSNIFIGDQTWGHDDRGTVEHLKVNPETFEKISSYQFTPQTNVSTRSYYGISVAEKDGLLVVGRHDNVAEVFKLDEDTGNYVAAYFYYLPNLIGVPDADTNVIGFGYTVEFGASNDILFISKATGAGNKSAVWAFRANKEWNQNSPELKNSYIADSYIAMPANTEYFSWGFCYDRVTSQLYISSLNNTLSDGSIVGAAVWQYEDPTINPSENGNGLVPTFMLRSPVKNHGTTSLGIHSRLSADGNFLVICDNWWINGNVTASGAAFVYRKDSKGEFKLLDIVYDPLKRGKHFASDLAISEDGKLLAIGYANNSTVTKPDVFELQGDRYVFIETLPINTTSYGALGHGGMSFHDHGKYLMIGEHGADPDGSDTGLWCICPRVADPKPIYRYTMGRRSPQPSTGGVFSFVGTGTNGGKKAAAAQRTYYSSTNYDVKLFIFNTYEDSAGVLQLPVTQAITFVFHAPNASYPGWTVQFVNDKYLTVGRCFRKDNIFYAGFDIYLEQNGVYNLIDSHAEPYDNGIMWQTLTLSEDGKTATVVKDYNTDRTSLLVFQLNPENGMIKGDDFSLSRVVNEFDLGSTSVPMIPVAL